MKRELKEQIINELTEKINNSEHFYLADTSTLNAEATALLRSACFKSGIKMIVVKNTLLRKALELSNKETQEMYAVLKQPTSIMFTETGNAPAKLIKDFRRKFPKPLLKAAYVEECVYVGDNQLDALVSVKSRTELIADVVALLQSPIKTVLSQLQSGGHIIAGVVKTLQEREDKN